MPSEKLERLRARRLKDSDKVLCIDASSYARRGYINSPYKEQVLSICDQWEKSGSITQPQRETLAGTLAYADLKDEESLADDEDEDS